MCLDKLTKLLQEEGTGYKVFRYAPKDGVVNGEFSNRTLPLNIWIHEEKYRPLKQWRMAQINYPPGFHVFKTLKAAKAWAVSRLVIKRVAYRKAFIEGYITHRRMDCSFGCYKCVVAKEIKILGNEINNQSCKSTQEYLENKNGQKSG